MKLLKSLLLAVIGLLATTNFASAQNTAATQQSINTSEIVQTFDVKVKGVGCSTDIKTISANVEKLDGVSSCKVAKKGATTTFKVTMNTALISRDDVYAAIEGTAGCKNPNDRPYKVNLK